MGHSNMVDEPVLMTCFIDKNVKQILSSDYSIALTKEGEIFVWGIKGIIIPHLIKLEFNIKQISIKND